MDFGHAIKRLQDCVPLQTFSSSLSIELEYASIIYQPVLLKMHLKAVNLAFHCSNVVSFVLLTRYDMSHCVECMLCRIRPKP
jgi:hypothetical protein